MDFQDMSIKEELLTILPLKKKTRGEDVYCAFKKYIEEKNIPIYKVVSITTDGVPSMTDTVNGFLTVCMRDDDFSHFLSYHCIIHQQALCCKILNVRHGMGICMKIVNSIRGRSLQRRMFRAYLEENESDYGELLYNADVRWLSRSIFLQRFRDLPQEVKDFLESKDETYIELSDKIWLMDLAFVVDITSHLNELKLAIAKKKSNNSRTDRIC
ncbi:general transcription factor II-I repeat domain-containing protein 2 [Trichonephila clavipes]|nr:general transcription factor II-I repeat domain-containing protein 2 [Trichonephila clavipes]